jgi:integrase
MLRNIPFAIEFSTVLFYGLEMRAASKPKKWETTRLQNLVRNQASGRYYARLYRGGKEVWKSLKTSHFSVAEARLATFKKEHHQHQGKEIDPANAKMTFGQAAALYMQRIEGDVSLKRLTRAYWRAVNVTVLRGWPGLAQTEVRRITPAACREWAAQHAKLFSATRYNGALSHFRRVLEVAVENGVLHVNPGVGLRRKAVRSKQLELPSRAQFGAFISEMRSSGSRDSQNCADLAQGLAFTGCRISEAAQFDWSDLNFDEGEILIRGDPEERTKNGEIRRVPMIPSARELLMRMREDRADEPDSASVFAVRSCQKAMSRAAKRVNMARITHHDLRHFFATICIESGVDIPTVSRWLGHKDGGALAMRTYGHLRREHSVAQAQKVSFDITETGKTE